MTEFGDGGRLPDRGVLLHVGPHKTGTTAIQGAISAARPQLAKRGILYPGTDRQQRMPALAVTNSNGAVGLRTPKLDAWERLVEEVHAARRKQVVISSEAFVEADDATAARIVEGLGGDRVHVVVTMRPLAKILPSAWQQNVRNRTRASYDKWLDETLNKPPAKHSTRNFWHRHAHDQVVERWMSLVGPGRVAAVVVSDVDRSALTRSFDALLGLPTPFLTQDEVRDNRGLTRPEVELVRSLNIAFHKHGWSDELYHQMVHMGVVRSMQLRTPPPDELRIVTPAWAVAKANQIARASCDRITELGVPALGDLSELSSVVAGEQPEAEVDPDYRLDDAGARTVIDGVTERLARLASPPPPEGNARPVEMIDTAELVKIAWYRVLRRGRAKVGVGYVRPSVD